ncbi:L-rhamnose operon regulatory protein rhaS [Serratia proteamaculans]|uniref:GlxA family transcriptional regulator n=1 Tax=Serratia proteamaculans TaxID=28151 RepID=UPI002177CE6E|nr:GlxA family transcriptional regulator [Serratia proteamaculans]CAI0883721.1 L-rhamnose operon regulatory protein rhaS [Serratia proteamaculans]CAI1795037.1 L-rhamnose operon regulatory protein rhaS [Serratia proteamaculans]
MQPRNVHFVIFPDVNLLDLSGALQVFSTANDLMIQKGQPVPYELHVVASQAGLVKTSAALPIQAAALPGSDVPTDTLVIAGGPGVLPAIQDNILGAWLKTYTSGSRRIVSICNGAFLLASCGLLDGRRAVTHWSVCAELAQSYPLVIVENDPIFIQDGPIWTSAGVTAGIDLALALINDDFGHKLALEVARNLVVFLKRPGGQAQFSTVLTLQSTTNKFSDLHAWIANNLTADLSVGVLATFTNMSERSFVRHYRKETGLTPAKAVEKVRLEAARNLLIATKLPIKRIAQRCGFNSEHILRRHFLENFNNSPAEYRRYFSQDLPSSSI